MKNNGYVIFKFFASKKCAQEKVLKRVLVSVLIAVLWTSPQGPVGMNIAQWRSICTNNNAPSSAGGLSTTCHGWCALPSIADTGQVCCHGDWRLPMVAMVSGDMGTARSTMTNASPRENLFTLFYSLVDRRCGRNLQVVIFKLMSRA